MYAFFKRKYIDVVYQGQKALESQQNYGVNFGYEFNLNDKHKIVPSTVFFVQQALLITSKV